MRRTRIVAVACGALLAIALAGCTPDPVTQAAVRLSDNGSVEVLLALCPDDRPYQVKVYASTDDGEPNWSIAAPAEGADLTSILLFSTPPGWQASGGLNALAPGQQYGLRVDGSKSSTVVRGISVEELGHLGDGEVWTVEGYQGRSMPESEFRRRATDRCG